MNYAYTARDAAGAIRTGRLIANDTAEAARQLRQEGLFVLRLEVEKLLAATVKNSGMRRRIRRAEIIAVTSQLAVMADAGVPLAQAIRGITAQAANATLKEMFDKLADSVEGGESFSAALARYPKQFDKTYLNLMKASEASGTLGLMLDRLATQMQAEQETKQKVVGALIYPAAMLLMCLSTSTFLLMYVFPKLTPMFAARNIDIPTPTKILMFLSDLLTGQWYYLLGGLLLLVGLFLWGRAQPAGRRLLDWSKLRLPIFGTMLRKVALSRSLRTLATTVNAGVPMLDCLRLSANVSGNVLFEEAWLNAADQVTAGRQIHQSLEGHPLFPPTMLQMVGSGETTGRLGAVLNKVADAYDREVAGAIKTSTSMIEPIMVFIMGGVIGTIALAMLLPIFKLSSHVG